ncbi:MAG: rhomboid family intramembrane serine protease [Gammaproteobacteria bacterium]
MMLTTVLEVFRSSRKSECDERAFVLTAVGIASQVHFDGMQYVLTVAEEQYFAAVTNLSRYAAESRPPPPPPPPQKLYPFGLALAGCVLYAIALLLVGYAVAGGMWRLDAFQIGAIDSGRVQAGEWWRAWTALTLHRDAAHLAANLGAGMWFGYLAGRQIGPGNTWLLTVLGAGFANLIESLLGPANHHSVGASTAVFTVLGLMAAYTWRIRYELPQRWALRWGPLIAGALLLGWMGTGGLSGTDPPDVVAASTTDIVAHASGFGVGAALGAVAALAVVRKTLAKLPQWATGLAAIAVVAVAWAVALNS